MAKEQAIYSHGHHSSVTTSHARRTAQDSAAFLLPHLKPHYNVLDIGCGPGSITCDLAALLTEGNIIGGDSVDSVLQQARDLAASRGLNNADFKVIDGNALSFEDETFDVVFCHQVLQHVRDPVAILKEMRRVAKPGGIVAAREADYRGFIWYPDSSILEKWGDLYERVARINGGEPNAGRRLHVWAREAGFEASKIQGSWSSWRYAGEKALQWGDSWAARTLESDFGLSARKEKLATDKDLEEIAQGWKTWGKEEDAAIMIPSAEVLCWK